MSDGIRDFGGGTQSSNVRRDKPAPRRETAQPLPMSKDDFIGQLHADRHALETQRDELLEALEAIRDDALACRDDKYPPNLRNSIDRLRYRAEAVIRKVAQK